jgi:L-iditol 2-dehydrogenase
MIVAQFTGPYQVEFLEKKIPEPAPNEVLLKVLRLGVCGTDIQVYMGKNKFMKFPLIPGHEAVCEIVKSGRQIKNFFKGELVVIQPQIVCGQCRPCRIGRYNVCNNLKCLGVQVDGLASEYYTIDADLLHKVPVKLPLDQAVLIEPFAVGVRAAQRADCRGAKVAIVGAGTIGNFTAQAVKAFGAEKVLIADISPEKLALALKCGIDFAVDTSNRSLKAGIDACFGVDGADVIIDCVGAKGVFNSVLDAASKASRVVVVGNYKEPVAIDVTKIQRNELEIKGDLMYLAEDFQDAVKLMCSEKVVTEGIITQRYAFKEFAQALEFIVKHPGEVMKAVINLD